MAGRWGYIYKHLFPDHMPWPGFAKPKGMQGGCYLVLVVGGLVSVLLKTQNLIIDTVQTPEVSLPRSREKKNGHSPPWSAWLPSAAEGGAAH
jgi:hypothetical protein